MMSYHKREYRDEVWTIVSGKGRIVIDGKESFVKPGDVVEMKAGTKHTIFALEEELKLIEVQWGKDISVQDKINYDLN